MILGLTACQTQPIEAESVATQKQTKASVSVFIATPEQLQAQQAERDALLSQTKLLPLQQYVQKHQKDPIYSETLAQVRAELAKRCAQVAIQYQPKKRNAEHLAHLTADHLETCPAVVAQFAKQLLGASSKSISQATSQATPQATPQAQSEKSEKTLSASQKSSTTSAQQKVQLQKEQLQQCHTAMRQKKQDGVMEHCLPLAEHGNANAQNLLGIFLLAKQPQQAAKWFHKAAERGLGQAQFNLGVQYVNGHGVKKSTEIASQWFQRAARQRSTGAAYNLGILYMQGRGVKKSDELGFFWFSLAIALADEQARQNHSQLPDEHDKALIIRDQLLQKLTPLQITHAQNKLEQFLSKVRITE
ncbi:tetratricopeptide repeat protein [Candidatus Venteria ishoeyi]|uniref:tetratricopeptide repeat protein n=1 Tax=Candidatus Venteria ishoeyi TaxID=1899563 RepID=UPI0025A64A81|nr:tetratricopeptide repeat protein [Candidatus Venteria ishoeyi]MDM8547765.1 tetratricopeptide repeat protein [Candidatus Venteria ishoeyi]